MNKQEIKVFVANGKKYTHYRRHKANSRSVAFTVWVNKFKEMLKRNITKHEGSAFKTGFNMGYKEAWERDNETISDVCLNCEIKLGFRGFCSKKCRKEYSQKG